jgi:rRNA maturation endonuclease Nob1
MITLTVSSLIFYYVLLSVISILMIWIISGYRLAKRELSKDVDYIWKCSVCFNTYVDSKHEDISVCTLCGSYNKREQYKGGAA